MMSMLHIFLNFLMIGLCDSSAKSVIAKSEGRWFDIASLSTTPPDVLAPANFSQKNFKPVKQYLFYIYHILDF